jgi:hypothetical protein
VKFRFTTHVLEDIVRPHAEQAAFFWTVYDHLINLTF